MSRVKRALVAITLATGSAQAQFPPQQPPPQQPPPQQPPPQQPPPQQYPPQQYPPQQYPPQQYPPQQYPPQQPYYPPAPPQNDERTDFEIGTLYATSIGYGVGMGSWISLEAGIEDPGIFLIP